MKCQRLVGAIAVLSGTWASPAHADTVTYWNAVTVEAVSAGRPGGAGFLDMALVHAAMHDAVQAIQRRFEPSAAALKGAGSPDAAAGAAAYGVLIGIYPKQQALIDAKYKEFLAGGFFGTDAFAFSVTSQVPLAKQKTRTYKRFSDAAAEVVEARILLGIHFRFADSVART